MSVSPGMTQVRDVQRTFPSSQPFSPEKRALDTSGSLSCWERARVRVILTSSPEKVTHCIKFEERVNLPSQNTGVHDLGGTLALRILF